MVKTTLRYVQVICALALLGSISLRAKDLSAYVVGDRIEDDIKAPVPLDLFDPKASAAKRSEEALKTPVIFRNYSSVTNEVVSEFLTDFNKAHKDFASALNQKFSTSVLDDQTISSPEFEQCVSTFNKVKSKNFPITPTLAKLWAKGDSGTTVQVTILGRLGEALRRPIAPDEPTSGTEIGETVRIVFMKDQTETLTLSEAESRGKVGGSTFYRKLAGARSIMKKAFPDDEQITAKALSGLIKPTCFVDEQLTKQSRDAAVASLGVQVHYAADAVIIAKGEIVDDKVKSLLDQLKNNAVVVKSIQAVADARKRAMEEQQRTAVATATAQRVIDEKKATDQKLSTVEKEAHANNIVLLSALGGVVLVSLLMVGTVFWVLKQRQVAPMPAMAQVQAAAAPAAAPAPAFVPAAVPAPAPAPVAARVAANVTGTAPAAEPKAPAFKINIAPPPVAAAPVRQPMVQEIPAPVPAPMVAPAPAPVPVAVPAPVPAAPTSLQEVADNEIAQLVKRLDKLYAPAHDRLRTYQLRIEDFERELAQRDVANPELLKLKIEALNRQMEIERKKNRINSDWGSV